MEMEEGRGGYGWIEERKVLEERKRRQRGGMLGFLSLGRAQGKKGQQLWEKEGGNNSPESRTGVN